MTPSARAQAAIELLDAILVAACSGGAAADAVIADYFRNRRFAGSGDRRAIRDLVYRAIRRGGERPPSGRAALLGLARDDPAIEKLFDGSRYGPAPELADEPVAAAAIMPAWLRELFDPLIGDDELSALLDRASLDLRVNRLMAARDSVLRELQDVQPTPHSPIGLRLCEPRPVEREPAWQEGKVEIQDEGSQLVSLACEAAPEQQVIDLCAGAGGKALALAAEMGNRGLILACDSDPARLARMRPRLRRAGVTIVDILPLVAGQEEAPLSHWAGLADLVLVDAPCSGSGTWRRNPEGRWRITPDRLDHFTSLQRRLLDLGASLVRPRGRLVYAVCSLLVTEGRKQAVDFTVRSSWIEDRVPLPAGRNAGPGRLLSPGRDGTDGFFVARWRPPC
ncbi:MAG: RsmB/NOP family class I SAM-dependent RNA methyltransferase [Sphingosinicella sp.]